MWTDPLHTKTTAEDCGSNVWTWHCTVSVTNRLRRLPVHGFLHRLLPSSVPKLTLCKYAERPLVLKQQLLKTHRTCVEPSSSSSVLPSGLIWGSNFSDVTSLRSSGLRLHTLTPSAAPAAIAAPRAVVSGMDGFTGSNNTVNISHIAILYNKTVCVCPASWHMINEFYTRLVDSQLSDLVSCIFTFQGFCGFFCLIVDKRK